MAKEARNSSSRVRKTVSHENAKCFGVDFSSLTVLHLIIKVTLIYLIVSKDICLLVTYSC